MWGVLPAVAIPEARPASVSSDSLLTRHDVVHAAAARVDGDRCSSATPFVKSTSAVHWTRCIWCQLRNSSEFFLVPAAACTYARARIRARTRARAYARGADHELGRLLDILELKDVLIMQFHVTLRQQPQYVAGPAAVGARVYAHTYVDAIAQARAGSWKGRSGDFVCVRHVRSPSDRVQSSIECEGCVASCTVRPGDATEQTSCMCTR